jgi:hypothetical protein
MPSLDWSQCPAVESIPDKVSGAWVFKGTRTPAAIVFENLEERHDHRRARPAVSRFAGTDSDGPGVRRPQPRRTDRASLMRVLFDNGTPRGLAAALRNHEVRHVPRVGILSAMAIYSQRPKPPASTSS